MDQKKIGSFLKELRKEKDLTQEQLAEVLNVSGRTVSRWETGNNMPDISILVEIAEFYDVSIPEIIEGERKSGKMNDNEKELAGSLSEYAEADKANTIREIRSLSLLGAGALAVYGALYMGGYDKGGITGMIAGYAIALVFVSSLLMPLLTTGILQKLNRKDRGKQIPKAVLYVLPAVIAFAAVWLIKIVVSAF